MGVVKWCLLRSFQFQLIGKRVQCWESFASGPVFFFRMRWRALSSFGRVHDSSAKCMFSRARKLKTFCRCLICANLNKNWSSNAFPLFHCRWLSVSINFKYCHALWCRKWPKKGRERMPPSVSQSALHREMAIKFQQTPVIKGPIPSRATGRIHIANNILPSQYRYCPSHTHTLPPSLHTNSKCKFVGTRI